MRLEILGKLVIMIALSPLVRFAFCCENSENLLNLFDSILIGRVDGRSPKWERSQATRSESIKVIPVAAH